jgi:hypothetical protein
MAQAGGIATLTAGTTAPASTVTTVWSLALLKPLLVGVGLGAVAGLGLHATFGRESSRRVTTSSAHGPLEPVPAGRGLEAVTNGEPKSSALPAPPVEVPGHDSRPWTASPAPRPIAVGAPRFAPARELPSTVSAQGLAEQQTLLDEARLALRRGDAQAAFDASRLHRTRFPSTAFEQEREIMEIKALLLLGRTREARAHARSFAMTFPSSVLLPSLNQALAAAEEGDLQTESESSAESSSVTKEMPR